MKQYRFAFLAIVVLLLLANSSVYAAELAHWKFEEGSGTTTQDETANNNDGTLDGGPGGGGATPIWSSDTPDGSDYSLDFDSSLNDACGVYVEVWDHSSLEPGSEITLDLWAKPESIKSYAFVFTGP